MISASDKEVMFSVSVKSKCFLIYLSIYVYIEMVPL